MCMKLRKTVILLLALAAAACHRPLFDSTFRGGRGRPPKKAPVPEALPEGVAVWATAIAFHDTTDWRAGSTGGVGILLFKNGERVDSLPGRAALKPEQHHFREGHLWTHTTDGYRSCLQRDGEPYLDYEGEERLVGFLLLNGQVHSLGQKPGGGFSYRINGSPAYTSDQGLVLGSGADEDWEGGAFCYDGGGVYYTVGLAQQSAETPVWEYRLMRGSDIWKVIAPPAGGQLFDVRVSGGEAYRLERRYERYCLIKGEEISVLSARGNQDELKLVPAEGGIAAVGNSLLGPARMGWLEKASGGYYQFLHYGGGRLRLWLWEGALSMVLMDPQDCLCGVQAGSWSVSFPDGAYRLQFPRCAAFYDGILALALTATEGNGHLLWVNGEEKQATFNGYYTGIYIE